VQLSALLLFVIFRSLVIPVQAALMNLLSIGAALGATVVVFQWGWLSSVLGVEQGPVEPWIPVLIFAVVFGLSMDYEVFLVSRVREQWVRRGDASAAVADGISFTGRVITAAAAIMVCVFLSFMLGDQRTWRAQWFPTLMGADRTPEFALRLPKTRAALVYATRLHEGQRRAVDGAPFISHPIEVGMLLYEAGASEDVVAAGLLHDTLEKTDATAYDIYARFGRRVGDIVTAVSHDPAIPGYTRRKAALRDQVADAGEDALTVFAADKLSKVRELALGDESATKARSRKLKHYRLSLEMLQERLPDSSLVAALQTDLDALYEARALAAHAG
jgi:hypothetical protein